MQPHAVAWEEIEQRDKIAGIKDKSNLAGNVQFVETNVRGLKQCGKQMWGCGKYNEVADIRLKCKYLALFLKYCEFSHSLIVEH